VQKHNQDVGIIAMNTGLKKFCKDKKLRRFLIISIVMFASITALSFIFFTSCTDGTCNTNYVSVINTIIIGFGIIGLIYCFIILKDFNQKVDTEILPEYKEMLKDIEKDDSDKLSFDKKQDDKKLLSF
jgi:hypothetical protein